MSSQRKYSTDISPHMWHKLWIIWVNALVFTGVNSVVCIQLMFQAKLLGTVLALIRFFSSVVSSHVSFMLHLIFPSTEPTPCTGFAWENSKTSEGVNFAVVKVAWMFTKKNNNQKQKNTQYNLKWLRFSPTANGYCRCDLFAMAAVLHSHQRRMEIYRPPAYCTR